MFSFLIAFRNMRSRPVRTLLTLAGILLGVAVVLAIQVTNQSTLDSLRQVFNRATGKASLLVIPSKTDGKPLDDRLLPALEKTKAVLTAAPSVSIQTLPADEAESWQITFNIGGVASGNFFMLYGIDPDLDPLVRNYELSAGRMPQEGRYELVIPEEYAEEKKLRLGNTLVLLAPSSSGGTVKLKVVGLLAEEGVALLNDGVVGFSPLKIVQDSYAKASKLDEIALQIENSTAEDPRLLARLKDTLELRLGGDADVIYPEARGALVGQMLATYQLGLTFFSIIALFVGAFLVYNTFSMTIVERTRETGMLRAIGMNRRQVLGMVLAEAMLLSLLGSALGMPAGIILARGLIAMTGNVVVSTTGAVSLSWEAFAQALFIGIGVTLVAALLPAWRATRVSPLEAIHARGSSDGKTRPLLWISGLIFILVGYIIIYQLDWASDLTFSVGSGAVILVLLGATLTVTLAVKYLEGFSRPLAARIYGNEGVIGSANVRRSVGRTTLTVASLMVSLTMIISISSVSNSFEQDMSAWIESALGGDLYVRSAVPMRESFARQLESVPGVAVVTPTRVLTVRAAPESLPEGVMEDEFYFSAIQPTSYRKIADMEFTAHQGNSEINWRNLEKGGSVFISNVMADRYQLEQGDDLYLLTHRGKRRFTVAAVVMDFTGQRGVMYGTYNDLHSLFAEQGADRFTLKVADGFTIDQVQDEIESRYQKRRHISLQTTEDFKNSILSLVERSFRLFDVLSMIGVLIGGLGVVNTLTMNVLERQREIGGLRSVGMTRRQVTRMVLAEALAHGIMGGSYGLLFGFLVAQMMIRGMNIMIGYDLVYRFSIQPFLIGAVIALIISQVAAFAPSRRAASVNIVEAIKHE